MKNRGEVFGLSLAALLFLAGVWVQETRSVAEGARGASFYLPAGLLLMAGLNHRLRSKVLAWGVFTAALVSAMIVFGTWALSVRVEAFPLTVNFLATTVLYASLAVGALFQLRFREDRP